MAVFNATTNTTSQLGVHVVELPEANLMNYVVEANQHVNRNVN
jgi:hypothetical protein